MQLLERVALITGAARGIGRACAERFLAAGAAGVVVADVDTARGESPVRELETLASSSGVPGRALFVEVDLTCRERVEAMVERTVAEFGRLDVLVNNAGIAGEPGPLESHSEEAIDRIFAVNVKGTWFACVAALPHFRAAGYGRVVNIASIAGKEGNPGLVPYSTTKAAVIGMTKAWAKEVATAGVIVNSVAPAVIETEILAQVSDEVREYMVSKIPMGRVGCPEEVAELVLFLASEACSFSTGACYDISGGRATY